MTAAGESCGALAWPQHVTCSEAHLRPPVQKRPGLRPSLCAGSPRAPRAREGTELPPEAAPGLGSWTARCGRCRAGPSDLPEGPEHAQCAAAADGPGRGRQESVCHLSQHEGNTPQTRGLWRQEELRARLPLLSLSSPHAVPRPGVLPELAEGQQGGGDPELHTDGAQAPRPHSPARESA